MEFQTECECIGDGNFSDYRGIISISIDRAQHKLLGGGGGGGDLYDGLPPKVLLINFKSSHHQHFISKFIIITNFIILTLLQSELS